MAAESRAKPIGAIGKRILGDVPRLPGGEGYLWVPDRGILDRVVIAAIRTFDSSRTSKRGVMAGAAARFAWSNEGVRSGLNETALR